MGKIMWYINRTLRLTRNRELSGKMALCLLIQEWIKFFLKREQERDMVTNGDLRGHILYQN